MKKHVHYDVDRLIAELKASDEAVTLPDDAEEIFRVVQRMRPAWREMLRAMFEEENRGTEEINIVGAFAWLQAEFLSNFSATFPHDPIDQIKNAFVLNLVGALKAVRTKQVGEIVTEVKVHKVEGGRA